MTPRRMIGILLWLVAIISLAVIAYFAFNTLRNPEPVQFEANEQGVLIRFDIARTHTLFNGDCLALAWGIDNALEIFVNDVPVTSAGERAHCDGTPPQLRIITVEDNTLLHDFPRWAHFDQWYVWALIAAAGVCAVVGGLMLGVHRHRIPALDRPIVQYVLALGFAIAWVFVLDLFTNSLNIYRYVWDHYHYIDMAENGVLNNLGLVAPYAYRPIPPFLAGFIGEYAGRSVIAGFRVVTYVGTISQLVLVFALARQFTRKHWVAWVVMIVIGLSTYHVKFLLFDIYRPDSLAYSVILVGMLAFVRKNRVEWAHSRAPLHSTEYEGEANVGAVREPPLQTQFFLDAVILASAALGSLVREFCAIPAALLAFRLLRDFRQTRHIRYLVEMVIVVGVVAVAYWLPRQIIQVGRSDQLIDLTGGGIFAIILNLTHDANVILGVLIYLLPLIILLTPERARRLWARLHGLRADLTLYTLIVLALTLIGGTDIARFVVYLFVPLIIALTILLDEGIHWVEIIYMLATTAIYNRIIAPVPQENLDAYLDFYIVWDNRISGQTLLRGVELAAWIAGALVLRWIVKSNSTQRREAKRKAQSEKA